MRGIPFLFHEPKVGGALAYCPESGGVFQLDEEEYREVKEKSKEGLKLIEEMKAYNGKKYTLNDFIGHLNPLGIIKERLSSPASVIFELTRGCNLHCTHCIVAAGEPLPNELKTEEWLKLVDEISEYAIRLTLTGGEPLTHPGFFEILPRAKERDLAVRVLTNGTLLEENAERLASLLDEWDEVQVSLDGTREVNDKIRGKGSFEKAVRGDKSTPQ
ncbi:radical SAM protein [Thermococcus sp. Bubb.Bath]|uniref:radical SAM protein n=1 Tax=Thermococcus sp. Bubb.Bath TaxID=1638242 RepID=UPI0014394F3E|nr:radical SAM protein [Thermococcus sp. Bubb.Bath]NJF24816.1 radical SAM protein [Thermococcus sp. Bubb.Bath]